MIDNPRRLIADYRSGVDAAADELAAHALRIALRTATAILGSRERAADVAQETAIDVLRGAGRLRAPEALEAWIHRIAIRRTMRALRRDRSRAERELPLGKLPETLEPSATELPHDTAEHQALRQAVRSALQLVPERQRLALVLRYVHDLSQEEIASALGVRLGTAGALLSRGRDVLRSSQALDEFDPRASGGEA